MKYAQLGKSPLKVSELCLGTMMFGANGVPLNDSVAMLQHAVYNCGINFIDTADVYNSGASERHIGAIVGEFERSEIVIATKVGNPWSPTNPNGSGLSRKRIIEGCLGSLKRLNLEYVDILYLHHDRGGPVGEIAGALDYLTRRGLVLYAGLSNFPGYRIAEFTAALPGRLVAVQPNYSMASRIAEREVIPAAVHFGLGVVTYSPLARGVLTGKYMDPSNIPHGSRILRNDHHRDRLQAAEMRPESVFLLDKIAGRTLTTEQSIAIAVQWVLANQYVSSCVIGPRNLEQLETYVRAYKTPASLEEISRRLDTVVAPGHNSTHNFIDPQHPVTGRCDGTNPSLCAVRDGGT